MAEKGLPTNFAPSANMGAGGPVTMAGAVALLNAECLAGLVLAQLKNRGTPFLYGGNVSALDMRTTVISYGAPEWSLSMAALADVARFYGLPVWGFGGCTDAKTLDAQAGLEATLSLYTAFLSCNTIVHDVGYLEMGYTSSMELIMLADEIIAMIRYIVNGMPVSKETLALEVIDRAQPGAGFLSDDHTLENWRQALFIPRFLNRQRYQEWEEADRPDLFHRLNPAARQTLLRHEVPSLPSEAEREIRRILADRNR
jgi:trimethylamine--corrinoid protein Co-methyltransferase